MGMRLLIHTGIKLIQVPDDIWLSHYNNVHNSDVIMGTMASQITSLSIVTQPFSQAQIKENIKAPRHWPLCGKFTGDRWIPRTKGQ